MNRGSDRCADGKAWGIDASMRPRFMNRGSGRLPAMLRKGYQGFNEAPIHESGK